MQRPKKELTKIHQFKEEAFCIKATVWKLDKKTKYLSPNLNVKVDQGSNLVIIIPKLVK